MGLRRVPEAQDEAAPGDGNGMRSHGMASRHSDAPGLGEQSTPASGRPGGAQPPCRRSDQMNMDMPRAELHLTMLTGKKRRSSNTRV